jgi:hypothetical protein
MLLNEMVNRKIFVNGLSTEAYLRCVNAITGKKARSSYKERSGRTLVVKTRSTGFDALEFLDPFGRMEFRCSKFRALFAFPVGAREDDNLHSHPQYN